MLDIRVPILYVLEGTGKPKQTGGSQTGTVEVQLSQAALDAIRETHARDLGLPLVSLIAYSGIQAINALDINLEITAQIDTALGSFPVPKVHLRVNDYLSIGTEIASYLLGLGLATGGKVGGQSAAGVAAAQVVLTGMATHPALTS